MWCTFPHSSFSTLTLAYPYSLCLFFCVCVSLSATLLPLLFTPVHIWALSTTLSSLPYVLHVQGKQGKMRWDLCSQSHITNGCSYAGHSQLLHSGGFHSMWYMYVYIHAPSRHAMYVHTYLIEGWLKWYCVCWLYKEWVSVTLSLHSGGAIFGYVCLK